MGGGETEMVHRFVAVERPERWDCGHVRRLGWGAEASCVLGFEAGDRRCWAGGPGVEEARGGYGGVSPWVGVARRMLGGAGVAAAPAVGPSAWGGVASGSLRRVGALRLWADCGTPRWGLRLLHACLRVVSQSFCGVFCVQ